MMKNKTPVNLVTPRQVFTDPVHFFAFGFGSGLSPIMPGTCGTIAAIPIYLLLQYLPLPYYIITVFILTLLGFWLCDVSAKKIGVHDYSGIVWDEIVGFLWVMVAVPLHWYWILAGFLLFRLFDIWKPWPIRWLDQKVKGGVGIVVDDLVAALYAWIVLQIIIALSSRIA